MGALLGGNSVKGSSGILGFLSANKTVGERSYGDDFSEGLEIAEIKDTKVIDSILLIGAFMPHIPFEFGGSQKIVKDYYPGSAEPAVQVLGARESDQTIKGVLNTKRFKSGDFADAAVQYQEKIDSFRMRGNLLRITLGDWVRYGFIEETAFKLNRLSNIEYEIKFSIVGLKPPVGYKFLIDDPNPIATNKKVAQTTLDALKQMSQIPSSMPSNLVDDLNSVISGIADFSGKITGFVDGIISDVEALKNSATRAVGMIRYFRSYLSSTARKVSFMYLSIKNMAPIAGLTAAEVKAGQINNYVYVNKVRENIFALQTILAQLQKRFETLSKSVPMMRHLVKKGDTLQTISVKYYRDIAHWDRIKAHNKLTDTALIPGTVLEIPKL